MPNLIGFLILIVAVFTGIQSDLPSNPLIGAGTLIIMAYLLSLLAKRLKLPVVYGFILAGLLAGEGCLGLLSKHFLPVMSLAETTAIMLVMFEISRIMAGSGLTTVFARNALTGILMTIAVFSFLTGALVLLTPIYLKTAMLMALFASTFSPITVHAFRWRDDSSKIPAQIALGALLTTITLWGIFVAVLNPAIEYRFRIALMPFVFAVTSLMAGIAIGLIGEFVYHPKSDHDRVFLPFMLVFLMIPLTQMAGLDYMFTAAGIGLYFGGASTLNISNKILNTFAVLGTFTLFGAKLPLSQALLLDRGDWIIVLIFVSVSFIVRFCCSAFTVSRLGETPHPLQSALLLTHLGPISLICLDRFLPAFRNITGILEISVIMRYCLVATILTITLASPLHILLKLVKPSASSE